jgi:hypothetical protein
MYDSTEYIHLVASLLQTWMVRTSQAQKRAIDGDERVLLSNKRGSRVQTIDKECLKIEVGSDS